MTSLAHEYESDGEYLSASSGCKGVVLDEAVHGKAADLPLDLKNAF